MKRYRNTKTIKLLSLLIASSFLCFGLFESAVAADGYNRVANVSKSSHKKYSPRLEVSFKGGNKRFLGRPNILVPIYQTNNSLLHGTGILMVDSKKAIEGNFGVGFRRLEGKNIYGIYGFSDIRRTEKKSLVYQATIGVEWFREYLEVRGNVYLPNTQLHSYSKQAENVYRRISANILEVEVGADGYSERALSGFDIDIGSQIPNLRNLTLRAAYYNFGFTTTDTDTLHGVRFSASYKLLKILDLDAEISYDKQRKVTCFGGATFIWKFDNSRAKSRLTWLERKMTSLPIRDIDVITATLAINKDGKRVNAKTVRFNLKDGQSAVVLNVSDHKDSDVDVAKITDNGVVVRKFGVNISEDNLFNKNDTASPIFIGSDGRDVRIIIGENYVVSEFSENMINAFIPIKEKLSALLWTAGEYNWSTGCLAHEDHKPPIEKYDIETEALEGAVWIEVKVNPGISTDGIVINVSSMKGNAMREGAAMGFYANNDLQRLFINPDGSSTFTSIGLDAAFWGKGGEIDARNGKEEMKINTIHPFLWTSGSLTLNIVSKENIEVTDHNNGDAWYTPEEWTAQKIRRRRRTRT